MTNSDDNASVIIDMLRENQARAESRSDTRHAEVMKAMGDMRVSFEAHEEKDDVRFSDIDKWRNRMIGGGVVVVTVLSFVAPAVAQAFGIGG